MSLFTATVDLNLDWNGAHYEGVAGTEFHVADGMRDTFMDAIGFAIEGLEWTLESDPVDGGAVVEGTLTAEAFAAGVAKVGIVAELPALPDAAYPVGFIVVLTTDGKIYRNVAEAWSRAVDGLDLIADTVTAGSISAGAVGATALNAVIVLAGAIMTASSGARCEMSNANGFIAYDSLGAVRMNIPITDNPISFVAAVQATTLTVTGSTEFQAAVSLGKNSVTTLQAGVQPPNSAPLLTQGLPTPVDLEETPGWTPAPSLFGTIYGYCSGFYDPVGGTDGATPCFVNVQVDASHNLRVAEWTLATGALNKTTTVLVGLGAQNASGITRIGTSWYIVTDTIATGFCIVKVLRSSGATTSQTTIAGKFSSDWVGQGIKTDGTYLYIPGAATSGITARVVKYNATPTYQSSQTLTLPSLPGGTNWVQVADFETADIGDGNGACFFAPLALEVSGNPSSTFTIYQWKTDGSLVANTNWPSEPPSPLLRGIVAPQGLVWDGTNFRHGAGSNMQAVYPPALHQYTNWTWTTASAIYWVCSAWYDDVGTTHETTVSPRASITMQRRRQLNITTSTIPVGGADDPNKVRIYMLPNATDPGAGAFKLQATDALIVRSSTTYSAAGSADGGGTAFPGGSGATVQSADGTTALTGDNKFKLQGKYLGAGDTFPAGPTAGDLFIRTDLSGVLCEYTASGWLGPERQISLVPTDQTSPYAYATLGILRTIPGDIPTRAFYCKEVRVVIRVAATNSGTKYWTVTANKRVADNTATSIGSFTTAGDTQATWTSHVIAVAALLATTDLSVEVNLSVTSTPGTCYCLATVIGRVVYT